MKYGYLSPPRSGPNPRIGHGLWLHTPCSIRDTWGKKTWVVPMSVLEVPTMSVQVSLIFSFLAYGLG